MRHIKAILAALAAAALFSGCSGGADNPSPEPYIPELSPEREENCVTPPFWVVQDESTGAQIFLLGSIHAGTEDVKYPDYVLRAYDSSSYLAPEMDTLAFSGDYFQKKKCAEYVKLKTGTAADYIGDKYAETVDFFRENGIYQNGMDTMIPYYWVSAATRLVMKSAGLDSRYSTETLILNLAHSDAKPVREIEGGIEQYRQMSEIPMSVQLALLESCVGSEKVAQQAENTRVLFDAWSSFNDDYFRQNTPNQSGEAIDSADWAKYYDIMYTERQHKMADFIKDSLQAGEKGFVMVGTMHFYAEPSIITLLEEAGYTAKEIRPEQSGEENTAA